MPWNNERMLTDADGNFIPQVWDPSQNKFVPYEAKVQLYGTMVEEDRMKVSIKSSIPLLPNATPKDYPLVEIIRMSGYGQEVSPRSVNKDGVIVGVLSTGKTLFKESNSFETVEFPPPFETGQRMADVEGFVGSVTSVYETYAGYVVVETIDGQSKSNVWFSEEFDGGFAKVLEMDRGSCTRMHQSLYDSGEHNFVMLLSEYGLGGPPSPGNEMRLFGSFDGGATWNVLLTLPPHVSEDYNSHWHCQVYDSYDGRIYASSGDGPNANLYYSDNLGETWDIVPLETYEARLPHKHPQPTLMMPFASRIAMSPDNALPPCVLSLIKDKQYDSVNTETFDWSLNYSIYPRVGTGSEKFAVAPFAINGVEGYFLSPSSENHRLANIVGTGDGGQTWHTVATVNLSGGTPGQRRTTSGLIGIDLNEYMYFTVNVPGMIVKIKRPEWLYGS